MLPLLGFPAQSYKKNLAKNWVNRYDLDNQVKPYIIVFTPTNLL
jgi:hypothetical protein